VVSAVSWQLAMQAKLEASSDYLPTATVVPVVVSLGLRPLLRARLIFLGCFPFLIIIVN
jgi:hypothetical protein